MRRWALAAVGVLGTTLALIVVIFMGPDWLPQFCSTDGDSTGCSSVSPLLVGLVGVGVSLALLFIGFLRSEP